MSSEFIKSEKGAVAVGMSGGVDSSVACALLKEQGYQVFGVAMRIHRGGGDIERGKKHGCYGADEQEDIEDARAVCDFLKVKFHEFDLCEQYERYVLDYFRSEYKKGRTPNPCLMCNRYLKFGFLVDAVQESGLHFDSFATGHYLRIIRDTETNRYLLRKGVDLGKDQTYFLSMLTQGQLCKTLFPLGELSKTDVRKIAKSLNLRVADKQESQDFISGDDYSSLLGCENDGGPILSTSGKELGRHSGIVNYTVGQRKGLGISSDKPLYVTAIDKERNAVIVGSKEETGSSELYASNLNWLRYEIPPAYLRAKARIRYRHKEAFADISTLFDNRVRVVFDEVQYAITPGQAVVFYDDDLVIGAGFIDS